jgi:hypothetical protein
VTAGAITCNILLHSAVNFSAVDEGSRSHSDCKRSVRVIETHYEPGTRGSEMTSPTEQHVE